MNNKLTLIFIGDNKQFEVAIKPEPTIRFKENNDKKYQIVLKKKTQLNQDYHKNTKLMSSNHMLITMIYGQLYPYSVFIILY